MKFLNLTAVVAAAAGLAQAAPAINPREGCDQGECPAINAGFDYIVARQTIGAEIRINAHGTCKTDLSFSGDGACHTFDFDGGFSEKVCIDLNNSRATRTGTAGFLFHQCWRLNRSQYCQGKDLWTPSQEVECNWFA
ncbi:hypothetical protein NLG97_g6748 [Lecanicillium saksenae]|uniref:Uncharacterized protein n=1 Tax=Lecanicillium saksenae TaxID=468837 RepID=A0ACC1QRY2_9HYPO|nr:hypothetical protein NLG97_g6748 [Lecanicillium saksenae]